MKEEITLIDGTVITMREPKIKDKLIAEEEKTRGMQEIVLFANLCEMSKKEIIDLGFKDYKRLQKAFEKLTTDDEDSDFLQVEEKA